MYIYVYICIYIYIYIYVYITYLKHHPPVENAEPPVAGAHQLARDYIYTYIDTDIDR